MALTSSTPETLLQWSAPMRAAHEHTMRWYAVGGSFVLASTIYGIVSGSWTVSVVAVLTAAVYYLLHNHVPEEKKVAITSEGIAIGERFVGWNEVRSYWLRPIQDTTELHIEPLKRTMGDVSVMTGSLHLQELRTALNTYTSENTERRETLAEMLIRLLQL